MEIGILIISTRLYKQFVPQLLDSLHRNFLLEHKLHIFLFTDEIMDLQNNGMTIEQMIIPAYGFPAATLFRYEIFCSRTYEKMDYLFYLDVDTKCVSETDEEILGDIVAVLHPGFAMFPGTGSWCDDKMSAAYTLPELRKQYFCGGCSGGRTESYYKLMIQMRDNIEQDEAIGVRAEWNDEAHLNKVLSEMSDFKILDSSYMMVEQPHLRKAWRLEHLKPRILALAKDHDSIRQ